MRLAGPSLQRAAQLAARLTARNPLGIAD